MTALTAPLDPDDFATEPEPEFWRSMLAHNAARIVADVQAGLDWSEPTYRTEPAVAWTDRVCTRCHATGSEPCVTPGGKVLPRFHVARG